MEKSHVTALRAAIKEAGSQAALAEGIARFMKRPTISQQTVSKWIKDQTLIAAEYWPAIEHVTGNKVTRAHLRPDVFRSGEKPARLSSASL